MTAEDCQRKTESVSEWTKKQPKEEVAGTGIKFCCGNCGQPLEADADMCGEIVECPACRKKIPVTEPLSESAPERGDNIEKANPPPPAIPSTTEPPNSKLRDRLKSIGQVMLGILLFGAFIIVPVLLLYGAVWVSDKVYPWLIVLFTLAFVISVLVLLPLAAFRRTRGIAGIGLLIASYVFGAMLWVWSLLLSYTLWGFFAVIVGIMMFGVGVVFIAVLATLFNGMWSILGQLVFLTALTLGTRFFSAFLITKADEDAIVEDTDMSRRRKAITENLQRGDEIMNRKQKWVLAVAVVLVLLAGLFPPWVDRGVAFRSNVAVTYSVGMHLLFLPPSSGSIDLKTLCLEWLLIALPAAGLWLMWRNTNGGERTKDVCEKIPDLIGRSFIPEEQREGFKEELTKISDNYDDAGEALIHLGDKVTAICRADLEQALFARDKRLDELEARIRRR